MTRPTRTSKGIPIVKLRVGEVWVIPSPFCPEVFVRFNSVPSNGTRKRSFYLPAMTRSEIEQFKQALDRALEQLEQGD